MTAFKYFKSLRKKHSHGESTNQNENLTAEETPPEFPARKNKDVVEHRAFAPGFKLTPMDEEIGPSKAVHDLPEVVELTEAADNLSAIHPPAEAELDHIEIPQINEAELEPVHEPSVTTADSLESVEHSETLKSVAELEPVLEPGVTTAGSPKLMEHSETLKSVAELEPVLEPGVTTVGSPKLAEHSETLKRLIEEKDSLYDRLLRKQAEFENFRKRTEKEKQEFYDFALSSFVQALLPVLDGLERSLSIQEGETVESFRKGNELILKQFRDQLWSAGIQPIRSMGKIFDPNFHQAVMREESSTLAENEIIEEYQRGYLFKDRLLRPSMVKVATALPATESGTNPVESACREEETPAAGESGTEG